MLRAVSYVEGTRLDVTCEIRESVNPLNEEKKSFQAKS